PAYEISNHARPGAESRHNLMYWRYGEYAGIGPGAHGRLGPRGARRATETPLQPDAWLTQVETEGHGVSRETLLTAEDERVEAALMGLRLREGVPLARIAPLDTARVDQLVADGFLWRTETELGATPQGRPVLNAVLSELLG
ncbi:MAG: coproporphyrinogen III oxidase, partial [Pseudomonadota bacterium]